MLVYNWYTEAYKQRRIKLRRGKTMSKAKKIFWISLGLISVGVGAVGVVLPILPTTPFLLLASFAFTKGSDRFRNWFHSTKLYKNHLESFEKDRSMTLKTKLLILIPVSAMLMVAFFMMKNIYGRSFIILMIIIKYTYFFTKIETVSEEEKERRKALETS